MSTQKKVLAKDFKIFIEHIDAFFRAASLKSQIVPAAG